MQEHEAREAAENQDRARRLNERIAEISRGFGGRVEGEQAVVACECSDTPCGTEIAIPYEEYELVRANAEHFIVAPTHEGNGPDQVVERRESYVVVRKRPGAPAEIARARDPRGRG